MSSVTDAAFLAALVTAEVALTRVWADAGVGASKDEISDRFGWVAPGELCADHGLDVVAIARGSGRGRQSGHPAHRRDEGGRRSRSSERDPPRCDQPGHPRLRDDARRAARVRAGRRPTCARPRSALAAFAAAHRDQAAAARTLTQHAVPTTVGLRAANWLRGVRRARNATRDGVRRPSRPAGRSGGDARRVRQDRDRRARRPWPGDRGPPARGLRRRTRSRGSGGALAHRALARHRAG